MSVINFNGEHISSDSPFMGSANRVFRYGDGIFESIRMFGGKTPFLKSHYQRLLEGTRLLHLEVPVFMNPDFIAKEITLLTGDCQNARIRLVLFRKDGGLYTPLSNAVSYLIEFEPLAGESFEFPPVGLTLGICPFHLAAFHHLSAIKTCNRLQNIVAAIFAKENLYDDCLILTNEGQIAESSSSNIFCLRGKHLITPPLTSGCIAGTIRNFIIEMGGTLGFTIEEMPVRQDDLHGFDEVFLTNAIQGIRPVKQIGDISFDIDKSSVLLSALNEFVRK
jgi:branched-chain amino acid aminotransferase